MDAVLIEHVMSFVANETSVDMHRLRLDTTIVGDLGLDGDEGWELMVAFGKRFAVDLSEFNANEYFNQEGGFCLLLALYYALRTLSLRDVHKATQKVPITIGDLVMAAMSKKWRRL